MDEKAHASKDDDRSYVPPAVRSLGRIDEFTRGGPDGSVNDDVIEAK